MGKVWIRGNAWRQGSILDPRACKHFNVETQFSIHESCTIAVSHDCDIANDNVELEPNVEVIVGQIIEHGNGNYLHGKSSRTLHISLQGSKGHVFLELLATAKKLLPKSELAQFSPNLDLEMLPNELDILRTWLSARYRRAAFPDAFNLRIESTGLKQKLVKLSKKYNELISAIGVRIDDGKYQERKAGEPYRLTILILYKSLEDFEESQNTALDITDQLEQFASKQLNSGQEIFLEGAVSFSEEDLTLSRYKAFSLLDLEYISMKNPSAPRPIEY